MGYQDVKFDSLTVRGHLEEAKSQADMLNQKIREQRRHGVSLSFANLSAL